MSTDRVTAPPLTKEELDRYIREEWQQSIGTEPQWWMSDPTPGICPRCHQIVKKPCYYTGYVDIAVFGNSMAFCAKCKSYLQKHNGSLHLQTEQFYIRVMDRMRRSMFDEMLAESHRVMREFGEDWRQVILGWQTTCGWYADQLDRYQKKVADLFGYDIVKNDKKPLRH